MTKHYPNDYRKEIDKDVPIAIGKEHTNTGAKGKTRYICPECRFPLTRLSEEEYYCNTDHLSFYPNEDNVRIASKVSMPRTAEENPPLVATSIDPDQAYLNKDKIEPKWGLKAMSESSGTIRITSVSEKDGAGRTLKKNRWS